MPFDPNTIIGRMVAVKQRLSAIPQRLGVPFYRHVIVQLGNTQTDLGQIPCMPIDLDATRSYLSANVEISPDDLRLTDIARSFDENILQRGTYLLDPALVNGSWVGIRHTMIHLDKTELLDYTALIRKQGQK